MFKITLVRKDAPTPTSAEAEMHTIAYFKRPKDIVRSPYFNLALDPSFPYRIDLFSSSGRHIANLSDTDGMLRVIVSVHAGRAL